MQLRAGIAVRAADGEDLGKAAVKPYSKRDPKIMDQSNHIRLPTAPAKRAGRLDLRSLLRRGSGRFTNVQCILDCVVYVARRQPPLEEAREPLDISPSRRR